MKSQVITYITKSRRCRKFKINDVPQEIEAVATLRAHLAPVTCLDFSPRGLALCSSDDAGWTVWWDLTTRRPTAVWQSHTHAVVTTKYVPSPPDPLGPDQVVTTSRDNTLKIWELEPSSYNTAPLAPQSVPGEYPAPKLVHTQDVNALNFCMAALTAEPTLMIAVPATTSSEKIDVYTVHPFSRPIKGLAPEHDDDLGTVMALALSEEYLVAGYESGHVVVFAKASSSVVYMKKLHKQPVLSVCLTSTEILSSGADKLVNAVRLSDIKAAAGTTETEPPVVERKLDARGVGSIVASDSLNTAVTAGWDGLVRVWNLAGLEQVAEFRGGRQNGIAYASIQKTDPHGSTSGGQRRLRPLPCAWIAVAGKDARIGLYGIKNDGALSQLLAGTSATSPAPQID